MILREININDLNKLLTEDQESDSIKKAIALYMNRMGCSKEVADRFVRIELREDLPNLRDKKGGKFILGVTRMFLNRELTNGDVVEALNSTIPYIASQAHINEYDKNLNGLTAIEVIDRFSDALKKDAEADKAKLAQQQYKENKLYDIVRVDTFEDTSKYREFCYPYDQWCITKYPSMLNSYTNNGIGQFYFCLKKGFENMEPVEGEGCPLDEYGLSMFAVCVDGDGRLKTSTCRWNHSNGGNDKILTTEKISELIGRNFYDVFKPNNKQQERIEETKIRLRNGEPLSQIFDNVMNIDKDGDIQRVCLNKQYSIVKLNPETQCFEYICDMWFDNIALPHSYDSSFVRVLKNEEKLVLHIHTGKIYTKDEALSIAIKEIQERLAQDDRDIRDLIDSEYQLWNGFKKITVIGKRNLIDDNGKLALPRFYDDVTLATVDFNMRNNYYFIVHEDGEVKLLDMNGNEAIDKTFLSLSSSIHKDLVIAGKDEEGWNVFSIKDNGKKLCKRSFGGWCTYVGQRGDNVYFIGTEDDTTCNLYTPDGEPVCKEMNFDGMSNFYSGSFIIVTKNKKENVLTYDGKIVSEKWYDKIVTSFIVSEYMPFFVVRDEGKESFLNVYTGKDMGVWFDKVEDFPYGDKVTKVFKDNKVNMISSEGELMLDTWYDDVKKGTYGFYLVKENGKYNLMVKGKLYLEQWADAISFDYSNVYITIGEQSYSIDIIDNLL